jgi:hypothetical protein
MVSGMELLTEGEQADYNGKSLERYRSEEFHKNIESQAGQYAENIEDVNYTTWRTIAQKESYTIWREDPSFRKRCNNDFGFNPAGHRGRKLAEIVALREAENGD